MMNSVYAHPNVQPTNKAGLPNISVHVIAAGAAKRDAGRWR